MILPQTHTRTGLQASALSSAARAHACISGVVSPDAVSLYMKTISSLRAGAVSSLRPRAPGPENWLSNHFQSESEGGAQQEG